METKIPQNYKSAYVSIIGLPNAGKSTLLNALLDIKLSIISARPQTTRKKVLGILSGDDYQVVFIDTPGIIKPKYKMQEKLMEYVDDAAQDADILIFIVDASSKKHPVRLDFKKLNPSGKPVICLLNKIDLIRKGEILPLIDLYKETYGFETIIPISAYLHDGIEEMRTALVKILPKGMPYYPPDLITDQPERFFAAEIIREKIFQYYKEEIPYSTEVTVEEFKERDNGKDYIYCIIYVERMSQKRIIIGKNGAALKAISTAARKEIEEFIGRSVYLELRVKVLEKWRKNELKLKRLGY
jgi:GTP-binding protein Era